MANATKPKSASDLIKYEAEALFSRDVILIAHGQNLVGGAVLGRITATGEYAEFDPAANDGSEVAAGVLVDPVDATNAADKGVAIRRHAALANVAVVWKAGISVPQKATAIAALEVRGVLIRAAA